MIPEFDDNESTEDLEQEQTEQSQVQLQYDVKLEVPYTLDEQKEIQELKDSLESKIQTKKAIVKGFESLFLNLSVFAVARWLVLASGQSGLGIALILIFLANQIVNRECLEGFNVNYNNSQWQLLNMDKLFKFGLGIVVFGFTAWLNLGSFYGDFKNSNEAFDVVQRKIDEFQNLGKEEQKEDLKILLLVIGGTAIVLGVFDRVRGNRE